MFARRLSLYIKSAILTETNFLYNTAYIHEGREGGGGGEPGNCYPPGFKKN
jgi:hypothetical protein